MLSAVKPFRTILFLICCIAGSICYGQITVKSGSSVFIGSGTTLILDSSADTLKIEDSTSFINNGVLIFEEGNTLSESQGYPITGNGYEQASRSYSSGISNEDIAGFGFTISTGNSPGVTVLKRGHADIVQGVNAVSRWFEIDTDNQITFDLGFRFDNSELNGINMQDLTLLANNDSTGTWFNYGGTVLPVTSTVQVSAADTIGFYVLAPYSIELNASNPDTFCSSGQLNITYTIEGIANAGNQFFLDISDQLGSFSGQQVLDTVAGTTAGTFTTQLPQGLSGGSYLIRLRSSDLADTSSTFAIYLRSSPSASFTGLDSGYCSNDPIVQLTGLPAGGIFSGAGIVSTSQFDPSVATAGIHDIHYIYQDQWGCVADVDQQVEVFPVAKPSISQNNNELISSLSGSFQWYLNGTPISGATGQTFETFVTGTYSVEVTNNYGCSEMSDPYFMDLTSIQRNGSRTIEIYPNPTLGTILISISSSDSQQMDLTITSIQGAELIRKKIKAEQNIGQLILDLSELAPGKYIVQLKSNTELLTKQIIKL